MSLLLPTKGSLPGIASVGFIENIWPLSIVTKIYFLKNEYKIRKIIKKYVVEPKYLEPTVGFCKYFFVCKSGFVNLTQCRSS